MTRPLRIAVISTQVFPCPPKGYAGLEMIAYQCAEGLAKRGHKVDLFAPEGSRTRHANHVSTGPSGGWDEQRAFANYHKRLPHFEVIIDHSWAKHSYVAKINGSLRAPVLGVCHAPVDTMFSTLPPVEKPCFVLLSKDHCAHFEALFGRPGRTCYNGIDVDFYRPLAGARRSDRALFLARFSSVKGPDIAVRACIEAGVGLDLVGDTSITNEPEYAEQVKSMCDGKLIRMLGPMSRDQTVGHYSRANFFLHPNERFREPFGLAPIEAQACGLPVIAWRKGSMPEMVIDGITGRLVSSYEEFVHAIRTISEWNLTETREMCRDWARKFSVDAMTERYESLCFEALEGGW